MCLNRQGLESMSVSGEYAGSLIPIQAMDTDLNSRCSEDSRIQLHIFKADLSVLQTPVHADVKPIACLGLFPERNTRSMKLMENTPKEKNQNFQLRRSIVIDRSDRLHTCPAIRSASSRAAHGP